jgi:hypothetical protein
MPDNNYLAKTEKISMILLTVFGIIISSRGVYWITNYSSAMHESPFYETLDRVAPLYIWGAPFLIGGILLMIASINIISQNTRRVFDVLLVVGGFISGLSFLIISMASMASAFNWMTPVQNLCFAIGLFSLTWIGLDSLWKNKRNKTI